MRWLLALLALGAGMLVNVGLEWHGSAQLQASVAAEAPVAPRRRSMTLWRAS